MRMRSRQAKTCCHCCDELPLGAGEPTGGRQVIKAEPSVEKTGSGGRADAADAGNVVGGIAFQRAEGGPLRWTYAVAGGHLVRAMCLLPGCIAVLSTRTCSSSSW